jgi:hypothetical protein
VGEYGHGVAQLPLPNPINSWDGWILQLTTDGFLGRLRIGVSYRSSSTASKLQGPIHSDWDINLYYSPRDQDVNAALMLRNVGGGVVVVVVFVMVIWTKRFGVRAGIGL